MIGSAQSKKPPRVALLGDYRHKPRVWAFIEALASRGYWVELFDLSNHWDYDPKDFAFAFSCGTHKKERPLLKRTRAAGKRTVILDLGYIKRASLEDQTGYHQVGIDRIGWLPPLEGVDDQRRKSIGLEVETLGIPGEEILVLGQIPGDSQHPFHKWKDQQAFLAAKLVEARDQFPGAPVRFRPHPLAEGRAREWTFPGAPFLPQKDEPLEDALDRASAVVTYNSTAAVEAVRRGIPVYCSKAAHYSEVSLEPSRDARLRYFYRLCYAQWNLAEIRSGLALDFILPYALGEKRESN